MKNFAIKHVSALPEYRAAVMWAVVPIAAAYFAGTGRPVWGVVEASVAALGWSLLVALAYETARGWAVLHNERIEELAKTVAEAVKSGNHGTVRGVFEDLSGESLYAKGLEELQSEWLHWETRVARTDRGTPEWENATEAQCAIEVRITEVKEDFDAWEAHEAEKERQDECRSEAQADEEWYR